MIRVQSTCLNIGDVTMSTPLATDSLVESVVVVILVPCRGLPGHGVLRRGAHCLHVGFCTSTLNGC
jgi:hypothetical protein